jgi:hypothetical protein
MVVVSAMRWVVFLLGCSGVDVAVAQCTISGLTEPANGANDCANGVSVGDGESLSCYTCNFGFTFMGTQPSCTGATFSPGVAACQGTLLQPSPGWAPQLGSHPQR